MNGHVGEVSSRVALAPDLRPAAYHLQILPAGEQNYSARMTIRSIIFLFGALLLPSCKDKAMIGLGTMGPALGPDGQVLANVATFDYNLKVPESVHILADGKRIKTVKIEGNGSWRIEVDGDRLKISEGGSIFELPVPHAGVLASKSSTNEAGQIGWDISVNGHNVVRIECSNLRIGQPTAINKAEQGVPPNDR